MTANSSQAGSGVGKTIIGPLTKQVSKPTVFPSLVNFVIPEESIHWLSHTVPLEMKHVSIRALVDYMFKAQLPDKVSHQMTYDYWCVRDFRDASKTIYLWAIENEFIKASCRQAIMLGFFPCQIDLGFMAKARVFIAHLKQLNSSGYNICCVVDKQRVILQLIENYQLLTMMVLPLYSQSNHHTQYSDFVLNVESWMTSTAFLSIDKIGLAVPPEHEAYYHSALAQVFPQTPMINLNQQVPCFISFRQRLYLDACGASLKS